MAGKRRLSPVAWFWCIAGAMGVLLLVSRVLGLMHGAELHPDERVFYTTVNSALEGELSFQTVKPYPNGAYVLQLPFHVAAKLYNSLLGGVFGAIGLQAAGRLAAVAYTVAGCVLGAAVCWRISGKSRMATGLYAAIMVFSLFQQEQSRYGTGDAISLFLFMLMLFVLLHAQTAGAGWQFALAGGLAGVLAAVKFPLALALLLPVALLLQGKSRRPGKKLLLCAAVVVAFVGWFVLFTPALFSDPAFVWRVIAEESGAYMLGANIHGAGTPLNHAAALVLYHLLYADLPLAPLFAGYALWHMGKRRENAPALFRWIVPLFMVAFLLVNVFATSFFLRALYPFFFLCNLYTAVGLARVLRCPGLSAVACVLLAGFMVARGVLFMYDLTRPSASAWVQETLQGHAQWQQRNLTVYANARYAPSPPPERVYYYRLGDWQQEGRVQLMPGEFLVTGAMDGVETRRRLFHSDLGETFETRAANWEAFKAENADYYLGSAAPSRVGWLYGGWLHGSTLHSFEFPDFSIYYRPSEAPVDAQRLAWYQQLYAAGDTADFLRLSGSAKAAVMVFSSCGDVDETIGPLLYALGLDASALPQLAQGQSLVGVADLDSGEATFWVRDGDQHAVDLTGWVGAACTVSASAAGSRAAEIMIEGRDYALNYPGVNVAVYDKAMDFVPNWFVAEQNAEGGFDCVRNRPVVDL